MANEELKRLDQYEESIAGYLPLIKPRVGTVSTLDFPSYRLALPDDSAGASGSVDYTQPAQESAKAEPGLWKAVAALIAQRASIWGPLQGYPRTYLCVGKSFSAADDQTWWADPSKKDRLSQDVERVLWLKLGGKTAPILYCIDNLIRLGVTDATSFSVGSAAAKSIPPIGKLSFRTVAHETVGNQEELMRAFDSLSIEYNCDDKNAIRAEAWGNSQSVKRDVAYYRKSVYAGRLADVKPRVTLEKDVPQSMLLRTPGVIDGARLAILYKQFVLNLKPSSPEDQDLLSKVASKKLEDVFAPSSSSDDDDNGVPTPVSVGSAEDISWESVDE